MRAPFTPCPLHLAETILEIADRQADGSEKAYKLFKQHRPRHNRTHLSKAPKVGDKAPDGMLHLLSGGASTLHKQLKAMATKSPKDAPPHVALVFGSRTCPVWIAVTATLAMTEFAARGVPTLQIYTKEANPSDTFPNRSNTDCNIVINQHTALEQRLAAAASAAEELQRQLKGSVPVLMGVDGMDDQLESMYESIPNRLYVIKTTDMTISYASNLGPLNPTGKVNDGLASLANVR